jgi:DNA-binding transcriptional ArsR family regulator
MINNLELFLTEANILLAALSDYGKATDRLFEVDLQQEEVSFFIDDIENIIQEREEISERADAAQSAMIRAISEQSEEDARLIRCVFEGKEVAYSLTGDKSLAKEVVFKLLAMQKDIIEKDGEIIAKFTQKRDEINKALKDLQGDKRKLDFLNLAAGESHDGGFNV